MIWADLVVVLVCILSGARLGGIGLGTVAALGLSFFVFGLGRAPGQFPGEVLLIVLCVVTLAASLQAAGGLDLMVSVAEKVLRRHPRQVTLAGSADLLCFQLRFRNGAHIILPAAYHCRSFRKVKERPERPLSISCHCIGCCGDCEPDVRRHRRYGSAVVQKAADLD